jgi:hypothetical protein
MIGRLSDAKSMNADNGFLGVVILLLLVCVCVCDFNS